MVSRRSNKEGGFISALTNTVTLCPEGDNMGRKKMRSGKLSTRTVLPTYLSALGINLLYSLSLFILFPCFHKIIEFQRFKSFLFHGENRGITQRNDLRDITEKLSDGVGATEKAYELTERINC